MVRLRLYRAVSTLVIILLSILITSVILFSSLKIQFFVCKKAETPSSNVQKAAKVLYNRKTFIYSVVMHVYPSSLTFQTTNTNLHLS